MCIYDACTMLKLEWHIYISRLHTLKKLLHAIFIVWEILLKKKRNLVEMFKKYLIFHVSGK